MYRSKDAGRNWEHLLTDDYLRDMAVSPIDPDLLFAASSSALYSGGYAPASHGVVTSSDGGRTWSSFNDGLPWPFASLLVMEPRPPYMLWLGSPGTGYYQRMHARRMAIIQE